VRRLDEDFGDDDRETSIWKKVERGNKYYIDVCVHARTRASARDGQVCVYMCVYVCVCSAAVLHDGDDNSGAKITTASTRVFFNYTYIN